MAGPGPVSVLKPAPPPYRALSSDGAGPPSFGTAVSQYDGGS
jgi:hypothetical protein